MERSVSPGAERALFVFPPTQVSDNAGNESNEITTATGSKAPAGSLEPLEGRRLLSSVALTNGTLTIIGNVNSDNSLGVWKNGSNLVATHNGTSKSYDSSSVKKIAIHGGKEDDTLWITPDVQRPSILKGYKGEDSIYGGRGSDWMYGGDDNDKLYGNDADDFGYGDDGNDELWGGKGKNHLSGGAGTDRTNGVTQGSTGGGDSGNDGDTDSNAASPKAVIKAQRQQIMAGHSVHVHGTGSSLGDGSPQNALYEWDFGDKGSAYNLVQGFNAAHLYEQPGTYTITLKVTNKAGKSHTTSTSVKVTPDTRKRIYVSESGRDSNSGTQSSPIRSFARAAEIVNSADNIEILFRRGDTFDAGTVMNIKGDNVVISSYGSGASPVIRWTDNTDGFPTIVSPKGDGNVVEYLTFTSTTSNPPQAIRPSGDNVTIRGNTFKRVGYAINANGKPDGLLVQGNSAPDENGIISYFVWGEGADHVYQGNKVANSNEEHAIRVVGADRVLVWDNDLTNTVGEAPGDNTPKGALTLHKGSYYWVARNALNEGPVAIGPLGNGDGMNDKGARFRYGVFDGNTFDTKVAIDHGAERIMFRNNIITSAETAILVEGYNGSYGRTTNDVAIVNNTVVNNQDTGRFISVQEGAVGVTLANNLYVAPNLTTGSGASASVYVHGDDLSSFKSIGNNVWAKADSTLWAQGGQNYVWPSWSNQSGYRDAGEWNGMSVVGTDYFSDVSISGFTPSGDSTAASAGRYFEGVFQDRNGKDRPNSGTWTAGAIQR